ncbi:BMP-binding endothelial regulator protein-like [Saccoglossus kowalevskii]|uniref:BMP-binding endothelial regulator protein-like n=1 Tax=Saccoglossus kowalevskii TaxID=10224 RepID=A0ABM0ML31_SACKO|nr:PREDICTED: BMP-binding endothelial regulator protein-like [Saccoglossus kowalevskii]
MHRLILLSFALVAVIATTSTEVKASPVTDSDIEKTGDETHELSKRGGRIRIHIFGLCLIDIEWDRKRSSFYRSTEFQIAVQAKTGEIVYNGPVSVEDGATEVDVTSDFKPDPEMQYIVHYTANNGASGSVPLDCGTVKKDPHVTTFDGFKYNFNGNCSYTLTKSCDSDIHPSFEVTADFRARNRSYPYKPVTFMVAFNVTSNGKQLIRINEDDTVLIKGKPIAPPSAEIGNDEGYIDVEQNGINIYLKKPALSLTWERRIHGLNIGFNDINLRGKVCGLLGNDDGNPHNDFTLPDGRRTFHAEEFGNSWLIPDSCP